MGLFSLIFLSSVNVLVTQPQVARISLVVKGRVRFVYLLCEGLNSQGLGDFLEGEII